MLFGGGQHHAAAPQITVQVPQTHRQLVARKRHYSLAAHHRHAARPVTHVARRARAKSRIFAYTPSKINDVATNVAAPTKLNYSATPAAVGDAQAAIAKVLHDDPTLRPGDAYMTADGLRVYVGEQQSDPKFVPVNNARKIGKELKARLAEVEKTPARTVRVAALKNGDKVGGAHASSEAKPVRSGKERMIKASNGKMIRFVGGYAG
jgi:hypothetical protein